jgi:hypothetical protein
MPDAANEVALDLSMAEAAEPSSTLILPAFQRRLLQVASPAGPVADDGSGRVAGAMRRLIVTPWFAAATGFVVAAGLWIYSPHAEFKLPAIAGGGVPCHGAGCTAGPGHTVPNSTSLMPITAGKSAGKIARSAPSRLKFGYKVLWQSQGRFGLLISVSGRRIPQTWRLAFALRGDTIVAVYGARWRAAGSDGGTVTWPLAASSRPGAGPQDVTNQRDGVISQGPGDSFIVVATGPRLVPAGCAFNNGLTCSFTSAPQSR